jgi:hypothetical protein
MLLQTEEHKLYHSLGTKDLLLPKKEVPLTVISMQKEVSQGEHWSVNVPIYKSDSRSEIKKRLGLFSSILQDRFDEFAEAWNEAMERDKESKEKTKED